MVNRLNLGIFIGIVAAAILAFAVVTKANPLEFLVENTTTGSVTASTTLLGYLSAGTGTSTIPYDTYNFGNANTYASNGLALALQFTGSTTPTNSAVATTTYNVTFEYSQDNIDWYSDAYLLRATTTNPLLAATPISTTFVLGTQTSGGLKVGSTTPTKFLLNVPAPTRYVRAIITIPSGSTNGAVWGLFIGQKQSSQ